MSPTPIRDYAVSKILKIVLMSCIVQQVVLLTLMFTLYMATGIVVSSQEGNRKCFFYMTTHLLNVHPLV